jgi:hypothetical protein
LHAARKFEHDSRNLAAPAMRLQPRLQLPFEQRCTVKAQIYQQGGSREDSQDKK